MYTSLSIPCSSLIFIPPRVEISTEITAVLKTAFEAIWTAPGRLWASILDQNGFDFEPPGAVSVFTSPKLSPHRGGSTIFEVAGAPKRLRKTPPKQNCLQERLGRLLGSVWHRFWPPILTLKSSWKAIGKRLKKRAFPLLEGMSSGSGRSGLAECARCVKAFSWRIRLGPGLAHSARRLKHARHTASGGRRI